MSDKYHDTVAASSVTTDDGQVKAAMEKILAEHKQGEHEPGRVPLPVQHNRPYNP